MTWSAPASSTAPRWRLQPQCLPALQGCAPRAELKQGNAAAARALLEAEARASRDPRSAMEAFIAAAKLAAGQLNDLGRRRRPVPPGAGEDPLNAAGHRGPGGSARPARRHGGPRRPARAARRGEAGPARLHRRRRRLPQRRPSCTSPRSAIAPRAMALVERALWPPSPATRRRWSCAAPLLLEAQQYAEAAAMLAQRVQLGGDPRLLAQLHLTLGALYQTHLNDAEPRLRAPADGAGAPCRSNEEALERLATLHAQARNWSGAVDCLKRLLELELPAEAARAPHAWSWPASTTRACGDTAGASALYRKALELTPGDADAGGPAGRALRARRQPAGAGADAGGAGQAAGHRGIRSARRPCGCGVADLYAAPAGQPAARHRRLPRGAGARSRPTSRPARRWPSCTCATPRPPRRWRSRSTGSCSSWIPRGWRACTRSSSCGRACKQNDKAFCAAAVLHVPALGQRGGDRLLHRGRRPGCPGGAGAADPGGRWTRRLHAPGRARAAARGAARHWRSARQDAPAAVRDAGRGPQGGQAQAGLGGVQGDPRRWRRCSAWRSSRSTRPAAG